MVQQKNDYNTASSTDLHQEDDIPFITNIIEKILKKYENTLRMPIYILLVVLLMNIIQICLVCKILLNYRNF